MTDAELDAKINALLDVLALGHNAPTRERQLASEDAARKLKPLYEEMGRRLDAKIAAKFQD